MFEFISPVFRKKSEKPERPRTDFTDEELLAEIRAKKEESWATFENLRREAHRDRWGDKGTAAEARRKYEVVEEELRRLGALARERGLLDEGDKEKTEEMEDAA